MGAKTILHVQDLEIEAAFAVGHLNRRRLISKFARWLDGVVTRQFDRVITIANAMATKIAAKGVKPGQIYIVRNWVDLDQIRPVDDASTYRTKLGLAADDFVILYSGNIGAKQGVSLIIDGAKHLAGHPNIKFVIAGDGPMCPKADPTDAKAIATLMANPATVGKIGTTCVVTMISGGHALNALSQRAEANVNCRVFPGHPRSAIIAELQKVANDPAVIVQDVTEGSVATPASPMRPDFVAAVKTAMASVYPDVPVFPSMASGASDSMWFRYHGVPSYGASPVFIKESEDFSHGLNERTPVATIAPSIDYYLALIPLLTK